VESVDILKCNWQWCWGESIFCV